MRSTQLLKATILFLLVAVLSGCALPGPAGPAGASGKKKPGLYDLAGWNNAWLNTSTDEAQGIDINGEVGYPLTVNNPTANCVSPTKKWTSYTRIISGEFPPGIYIEGGVAIKGTPKKRGHYIAVVENYGIRCNETDYGSIRQELRFHITGTGIVNEGKEIELAKDEKAGIYYIVNSMDVEFIIKTNGSPSIQVDVNQNGIIDRMVDRSYGMEAHKLLCSQYLIDETSSTLCGQAPTRAKLSINASEYKFTIPKSELGTGRTSVLIAVYFGETGGGGSKYYPDYGTFGNGYKIELR